MSHVNFYQIKSSVGNKIYIGCTKKPIQIRLIEHKSTYNFTTSQQLFQEYGIETCTIELLHSGSYSKEQSKLIERNFIIQYKDRCVNKNLPNHLTLEGYRKEYYKQHRDTILEQKRKDYNSEQKQIKKEYYKQHRDSINRKTNLYYHQRVKK